MTEIKNTIQISHKKAQKTQRKLDADCAGYAEGLSVKAY